MNRKIFLLSALFMSPFIAAQENNDDSAYKACMEKNQDTAGMVECTGDEYDRQDKRLNKNYQKQLKSLPSKEGQALKKAQKQWIAWRNAKCDFLADLTGGTMDRLENIGCLEGITHERADELGGTEIAAAYSDTATTCLAEAKDAKQRSACIVTERAYQDKRLNENYQALQKRVEQRKQKEVVTLQKAWIKWRDAQCAFMDLHSAKANENPDCLATLTSKRADELSHTAEEF
ncbi:MAG: lysozyme inhibitor LprI family protein [Cardiobacteriaceae bacterium]|nr:lysozyme inhibitor LprI family protein [Cardiobacteriaceae bacterium]